MTELLQQADEATREFWRLASSDGYSGATLDSVGVSSVIRLIMANNRRYNEIKALADEVRGKEWQPIEEIHGKEGRAWLLCKDYHLPEYRYKDCSIEEFQYGEQPEYPYGVGWFTMDWWFMMKEKEYSHFLIIPHPPKET